MDNNDQNLNKNNQNQDQDTQSINPQLTSQTAPQSIPQKVQKEQEPFYSQEAISASEHEPNLHPEVQEAGVEKISDKIDLTNEHFKAGIEHAKESAPVATQPRGIVQLPPTYQATEKLVKKYKVSDSFKWFLILWGKLKKGGS